MLTFLVACIFLILALPFLPFILAAVLALGRIIVLAGLAGAVAWGFFRLF